MVAANLAADRAPTLLALDFDGVVCDGLREYFQTAWKVYGEVFEPDHLGFFFIFTFHQEIGEE